MNKTRIMVVLTVLIGLILFCAYNEHRITQKDNKIIILSEKLSTTKNERDGLKQEIFKYNNDTKIYKTQIQNLQNKVKEYEDYSDWGSQPVHPAMVDWLLELQELRRQNRS